jgi:alpha-tubulin suppressor-like RCC1 family protein
VGFRLCLACVVATAACYAPPKDLCGIACTTTCPDGYTCTANTCMPNDGTKCAQPSLLFVAVQLGARHACGLDNTRGLFCWGDNTQGQIGEGTAPLVASPQRVGNGTWDTFAVGGEHTCAIEAGVVSCWGRNTEGEAVGGEGANISVPTPVAISPQVQAPPFARVAAGGYMSCALGAGELWCWGQADTIGDNGVEVSYAAPIQPSITDWTEVSLGAVHGCGITTSHGLLCWGENTSNQAVPGAPSPIATPTPVALPNGLVPLHVFAKNYSTCVTASTDPTATTGQLWCWGDSPGPGFASVTQIGSDDTWSWASPDGGSPCGVRAGQGICWGAEVEGELGDGIWSRGGSGITVDMATPLGSAELIDRAGSTPIEPQTPFACMISGSKLSCWGANSHGELGQGKPARELTPVPVAPPSGATWTKVVSGDDHACAVASTGTLYCWGYDGEGAVRAGVARGESQPCIAGQPCNAPTPEQAPSDIGTPDELVAGTEYTCEREASTIHCWGRYQEGELGAPGANSDGVSTVTSPMGNWTAMFGGSRGTCGLAGDQLECWGIIAAVATDPPTSPGVSLLGPGNVVSMGLGNDSGCAILSDNSRVCWGNNAHGDLGDATTTPDFDPAFAQEPGIASVVVAGSTGCELTVGSGVSCWGDDVDSGAGDPSGADVLVPDPITDGSVPLAGCTALAWDNYFGCAICNDVPECWGDNSSGQLGRGSTAISSTHRAAPVLVPMGKTWTEIAVGDSSACALDSTGELYCWGDGAFGQLGDGSFASNLPVPVAP